jgi:hypothetical protein
VARFLLGDERTGGRGATLVTLKLSDATIRADTGHPVFLPSVDREIATCA